MKSNSIKYRLRELTYECGQLVSDHLYSRIFNNLEEVNDYIKIAKFLDDLLFDQTNIYIVEAL